MAFYDYRDPIEYVVDRYFERKRFHSANSTEGGLSLKRGEYPDNNLPEIPCQIIRNNEDIAYKFIYGETELLLSDEEADPVIWQEELVRDDSGVVVQIIITFPDGESVTTELVRDSNGTVTEYRYN